MSSRMSRLAKTWLAICAAFVLAMIVIMNSSREPVRAFSAEHMARFSYLLSRPAIEICEEANALAESLYVEGFPVEGDSLCKKVYDGYSSEISEFFLIAQDLVLRIGDVSEKLPEMITFSDEALRTIYLIERHSTRESLRAAAAYLSSKVHSQNDILTSLQQQLDSIVNLPQISPFVRRFGEADGLKLSCGIIWIGMDTSMVRYAYGKPTDVDRRLSSYGYSEDWTYREFAVVDDGIITLGDMLGRTRKQWTGKAAYFSFENGSLSSWSINE